MLKTFATHFYQRLSVLIIILTVQQTELFSDLQSVTQERRLD